MFSRDWRQREQNAKDKLAERTEREADPAYQAIKAAREQHRREEEDRQRAAAEAARMEREGPALEIATLMTDKLGPHLPEILAVFAKPGGKAKVMSILEQASARELQARDAAARAAEDAGMAELSAVQVERARTRDAAKAEERAAKRKAKAEAVTMPAEIEGAEA